VVSRIGFTGAVPDATVRSEARGGVEIIHQLGGKARVNYERAAGVSAVDGEAPIAPSNPQGDGPGVDLSGPPFGSALRHPIFWWSWLGDDADVQQPTGDKVASFIGGLLLPAMLRFTVWNRPHAPTRDSSVYKPPYSRALIVVRGHRTTGAGAAQLTGRARNVTMQETFQVEQTGTAGATTSSTTETGLFFTSDGFFVRLLPGLNEIALTFLCTTVGHAIQLDAVAGLQTSKRGH
jgi:hypothetical protein